MKEPRADLDTGSSKNQKCRIVSATEFQNTSTKSHILRGQFVLTFDELFWKKMLQSKTGKKDKT